MIVPLKPSKTYSITGNTAVSYTSDCVQFGSNVLSYVHSIGSLFPVLGLTPITAHVVSDLKVTQRVFSVVFSSLAFKGLNLQYTRTLPLSAVFGVGCFKKLWVVDAIEGIGDS